MCDISDINLKLKSVIIFFIKKSQLCQSVEAVKTGFTVVGDVLQTEKQFVPPV